jgi:hypothetical protein
MTISINKELRNDLLILQSLNYDNTSSFDQFKKDCFSAYDIYKTTQNRYNYKLLTFENWVNGQIIALQSF